MIRQDISRLRKNRSIHFQIAMICSLSFVITAFNYTTIPPMPLGNLILEKPLETEEIVVARTVQKKPTPPPILEVTEKIETVEDVVIPEEIQPQTMSLNIDDEVEVNFEESYDYGNDEPEIEPEVEEPLDILIEEAPRDFAEYMPSFGDCNAGKLSKEAYKQCSDAALLQYIAKRIKYPSVARENKIEGRVVLKFVVDEKGEVRNMKIVRGVAGGCTEEAVRVLKNMPQWKPGRHGGRNVKVYFTLPITFILQ